MSQIFVTLKLRAQPCGFCLGALARGLKCPRRAALPRRAVPRIRCQRRESMIRNDPCSVRDRRKCSVLSICSCIPFIVAGSSHGKVCGAGWLQPVPSSRHVPLCSTGVIDTVDVTSFPNRLAAQQQVKAALQRLERPLVVRTAQSCTQYTYGSVGECDADIKRR